MLGNSIALIGIAAMFGVGAHKANERLPRIILTALAVIFALWAVLVQPITDASPKIGAFVTGIFAEPSSWFILAMALFFLLRPYWQGRLLPSPPVTLDEIAAKVLMAG